MNTMVTIFSFLLLMLICCQSISSAKSDITNYEGGRTHRLIIGGFAAKPKQFPYAVSVQRRNKYSQYIHTCTFSLITTKSVLGAAHCVVNGWAQKIQDVKDYIGVFGTADHWDRVNNETFEEFRVHPGYNNIKLFNDIAILVFSKPIKTGAFIKTVPLIGPGYSFIGKRGITLGWGFPRISSKKPSRWLRYVDVDIADNQVCGRYYYFFGKGQFCFGTEGRSGCNGDSGAPIMVRFRRKNVQMGILSSSGNICAIDPTVGINVSSYNSWIRGNVVGKPVFVN